VVLGRLLSQTFPKEYALRQEEQRQECQLQEEKRQSAKRESSGGWGVAFPIQLEGSIFIIGMVLVVAFRYMAVDTVLPLLKVMAEEAEVFTRLLYMAAIGLSA
jgi:hypothetical protein